MNGQAPSLSPKKTLKDEFRTISRFIFSSEKNQDEILFFASQAQYISYYEGLVKELNESHQKKIIYLSSDSRDKIFDSNIHGISPVYAKVTLPYVFPLIDSAVVVTTVPDLHQYKIKRSFSGTNYVYVFHSLVSSHMMYRLGAFDNYDTVFCTGPHHMAEIRKTEELYGLPVKKLHEVGYSRLEKIHKQHQDYVSEIQKIKNQQKLVLIAPSWHEANILNTCAVELVESLLTEGLQVVVRPHPMTITKTPNVLTDLRSRFRNEERFQIDMETTSEDFLHRADVMICDWSGVALEYAFGTERPVLFVDLPKKIYNPEYEKLGIEPIEVKIRDQIGNRIKPEQAGQAGRIASDFINRADDYRQQIIASREANVYNFGSSSIIGADIITTIQRDGIKGRISKS